MAGEVVKQQLQEQPVTLARYLALLDKLRHLSRLGRVIMHEERAPIDNELKRLLKRFDANDHQAAMDADWRRDPALFDAREAEGIRAGLPASERPHMGFDDIPQFPHSQYEIDVSWCDLERHIANWERSYALNLDPDFQRGHVWTKAQQTAYVEYQLQGGEIGKSIIFNHPSWNRAALRESALQIVDGKQRLEAVRAFLRGDVTAFGRSIKQFNGQLHVFGPGFRWKVVALHTREQLLRLYLNINAGGTPHTPSELQRVRWMLDDEISKAAR